MADNNVEKVADLAVPDAGDLDGWTIEDHLAAHRGMVQAFARQRLVAGVLLWNARRILPDGKYGDHVAEVAAMYQVEPRSLARWRADAEQERGLPPATPRAQTKQEQRATRIPARSSTPAEVVKPDEVIPPPAPPQRPKAAPVQQAFAGSDAWGKVVAMTITELAARPPQELRELQRKVAEALRLRR